MASFSSALPLRIPSRVRWPGGLRPGWRHVLVFVVVFLVWLPAIGNGLVWDDYLTVLTAHQRWTWWNIGDLFVPLDPGAIYLRPIPSLSFYGDQAIWGAGHVWGWHLTNIAIHAVNAALVTALLRPIGLAAAVAAGLTFGLHPVNTEAVGWISSRPDLTLTFFLLASTLLFLRGRPALSAAAFGLALLSKEMAMPFPFLLAAWLILTHRSPRRSAYHWLVLVAYVVYRYLVLDDPNGPVWFAKLSEWAFRPWWALAFPLPFDLSGWPDAGVIWRGGWWLAAAVLSVLALLMTFRLKRFWPLVLALPIAMLPLLPLFTLGPSFQFGRFIYWPLAIWAVTVGLAVGRGATGKLLLFAPVALVLVGLGVPARMQFRDVGAAGGEFLDDVIAAVPDPVPGRTLFVYGAPVKVHGWGVFGDYLELAVNKRYGEWYLADAPAVPVVDAAWYEEKGRTIPPVGKTDLKLTWNGSLTLWVHDDRLSFFHAPETSQSDRVAGHDEMLSANHDPETSWVHDGLYSGYHDPTASDAEGGALVSPGHDEYFSANHDSANSWIHDGAFSKYHEPTISAGGHRPAVSLGHDPFFSDNHDPATSWVHDGSLSRYHDPALSGSSHDTASSLGHDPFLSANHDPDTSWIHDGSVSKFHDPQVSTGLHHASQSLGHDAFYSRRHDPSSSWVHDGVFSHFHEPAKSESRHSPAESFGHDPFLSDQHDPATTWIHDGSLSRYHTPDLSDGGHASALSLGHDAYFSKRHDPSTSWIHDGAFSQFHDPSDSGGTHDVAASVGHESFFSAAHNPETTWFHDGYLSSWHDPAVSASGHSPEASFKHDPLFSAEHDPATTWLHDGIASRFHAPDDSATHYSPTSLGHDVFFSRAHDFRDSSIAPAVYDDLNAPGDVLVDVDGDRTPGGGTEDPAAIEVADGDPLTSFQPPGHSASSTARFEFGALPSVILVDRDRDGRVSRSDTLALDVDRDGLYTPSIDTVIWTGDAAPEDDGRNAGPRPASSITAAGDLFGLMFHDRDGDGRYELGEDVVIDVDGDRVFDGPGVTLP